MRGGPTRIPHVTHPPLTLSTHLHTPFPVLLRNLLRLELAGNGLVTLELDDGCPSLRELIVANNTLASLKGIAKCPRLRLLDADNNAIKSLAGLTGPIKEWAGDAAAAATALPTTPAAAAAAVAAPREPSEDDSEAEAKPLYRLRVLSLRGNALPEDSWSTVDGLAALSSLRELRLGGNPLVGTQHQPRRLDLSAITSGAGGEGESERT